MAIEKQVYGFSSEEEQIEKRKRELLGKDPVSFFAESEGRKRNFQSREEILAFAEENPGVKAFVSIAGVELEMWMGENGSQFDASDFQKFALDDKAMELLLIMAKSIKLDQPPLVEGETDIGKSRALEYLAHLTNHHLIYQSFSGQTDVTELIGKYVPRVSDEIPALQRREIQKKIDQFVALFDSTQIREGGERVKTKAEKRISDQSQRILRICLDEGRGPTEAEMKEIAKNEGYDFTGVNWQWQDGTVPMAMEANGGKGCWLYFDELGAAEPQILVKLNRVLTTEGLKRLEITENGSRQVVGGPNFRLIASTNPPAYAGRIPFEKDFLRRWNYQVVGRLSEEESLGRDLAREIGEKPAIKRDFYQVGRRKESTIKDFGESEFARETYKELAKLHTKFLYSALAKLEATPAEIGEQQFRYEESDKIRAVAYLKEFQKPDLVETLKEATEFYYLGKINPEKMITEADGREISLREALRELFEMLADQMKTREKIQALIEKYQTQEDKSGALKEEIEKLKVKLAGMENLEEDDAKEAEEILAGLK